MPVKFPCKICEKSVAENLKAVCCNTCNIWVHIKCNKISTNIYNILKKKNTSWCCIKYSRGVFPFSKLDNTNFLTRITDKNLNFMTIRKKHNTQEGTLIDRINDTLNTSDLENSTVYFNVNEFNEYLMLNTFNSFNTLHFNIFSLLYNVDQLSTLINTSKVKFDIIGITESGLTTDKQPKQN